MSKYTDIRRQQVFKAVEKQPVVVGYTPVYGSFYDTTTQTVASGGIKAVELNNTDLTATSGVTIVNDAFGRPTKITVSQNGVYDFQFSFQLYRVAGGSSKEAVIWFSLNGTNVPDSATHVTMQSNTVFAVAAWNFFAYLNAGEYAQIMWTQNDAIDMIYYPENLVVPYPATPSAIVTVNRIS